MKLLPVSCNRPLTVSLLFIPSVFILLSLIFNKTPADIAGNIDQEENESADDSDGADDEGWESDSSGHTNTRELSSLDEAPYQDPAKKVDNNVQICETGKPIQFIKPLSSTLARDSTGISEIKVDPKLSPVEPQPNNEQHIELPNHMLDQEAGCSFMPGILGDNILTSTKLESSCNALRPLARTSSEREIRHIADQDPSPNGLASFARAVLSTRNKIRNVLMTVDLRGYSSTESGYDSLSTDATSSSSTVQSTLNESICPPDKLLKEFSNRLTAEIFSNRPNYSHSALSNALTRRDHPVQKTRMLMGPNATESNKNKTVSLLANRRTIKFNPSLPELRKRMSSIPLTSGKKSMYIPLSMSTETVDQYGRLKKSMSTKAVLKISPVQSPPPLLAPMNPPSITRSSPEQSNKLQLVQKSENLSKPVIKLQESGCPRVAVTRRRSVPLTNCLPVTNSEVRRHSTNLLSVMHREQGPEALPGQDRGGNIPRNIPTVRDRGDHKIERWAALKVHPDFHTNIKHLPGQDGRKVSIRLPGHNNVGGHLGKIPLGSSRKRSFESALYCANVKTSPKRTCRRSDDDYDEGESPGNQEIESSLRNTERQRKQQGNVLEVFNDVEVNSAGRGCGKTRWNEDQSPESDAEKNFAVKKERRQSQKLLIEGTRSPCPVMKASPHNNMKIPRKLTNEGNANTKNAIRVSCHKDTATVDNRYQTMSTRGRINKEVVSPIKSDHSPRQLIQQNSLEKFKKLSHAAASGKAGDSRAKTSSCSSEKHRISSCTRTSKEDDHRRSSSYESAVDESCSRTRRFQTANIRTASPERPCFPFQSSRPILNVDDQNYKTSSRNNSTTHRGRSSSCSTLKKNLSRASEKTLTGEIKSSGRKRDRERKDEAQGFEREICLNKTFTIDERPYDSCSPSYRCTKFICLNCGKFPSAIVESSQSSADSFIGD